MTTRPGPLRPHELEAFDRDGFLVIPDVFSDADLQPVIDEISAEVDRRARELVETGELSRPYDELDFERRLAQISRETDKVALSIWNGVLSGPAFFELIRHPKLLDIAEQFVGPEIVASSVYRLRPKIPGHIMGPVPWHQDSGYTEPFCDKYLMLTVWLPLVDASEENGCMWVIPGVHKSGVFQHVGRANAPYLVIPDEAMPAGSRPVCCPVPKGGILLLTNTTPHASFENSTDRVRWSMDLRYQSAALPTNYPMTRLDDETVANEPGVPVACYPPEADCLIRSRARPHEVVQTAERFNQIRQDHHHTPVTRRWQIVEPGRIAASSRPAPTAS